MASAVKLLIRTRDTGHTGSCHAVFVTVGTRILQTPVQAPPANAIGERVIGTMRCENLDRMILLDHGHLETVLVECAERDNSHRPHGPLNSARLPRPIRPLLFLATSASRSCEEPII